MVKVVEIRISNGGNYAESVKGGKSYTSVDFCAGSYGGCSPCDNTEEINQAVRHFKEWITKEGDSYKIVDKREVATLSNWF